MGNCIKCGEYTNKICDECDIAVCQDHSYEIKGNYGTVCEKCYEKIRKEEGY